jgi:hypothetical protein
MKIACAGFILLLALPVKFAAARPLGKQQTSDQQQQASIAETARRNREQKKSHPPATHSWDNDNIPTNPNELSVVGSPAAPPADENAPSARADNAAGAPAGAQNAGAAPPSGDAAKEANNQAAVRSELDSAKDHLKTLMTNLDILSRQYTLDQQQYYSKPNYSSDRDGQERLNREQSDVEAKRQEVAEAQKKVDELQANLGPPSSPQPPQNPN